MRSTRMSQTALCACLPIRTMFWMVSHTDVVQAMQLLLSIVRSLAEELRVAYARDPTAAAATAAALAERARAAAR